MIAGEGDGMRTLGEGDGIVGEDGLITTEAPVSTTGSWLNAGFLGSIGAVQEEGSGLEPEVSNTYNQQYKTYNLNNFMLTGIRCILSD